MTASYVKPMREWSQTDDAEFDEIEIGDTVWPDLGRVGSWPCTVIGKNVVSGHLMITTDFCSREKKVFMKPLFLVMDYDWKILDSSDDCGYIGKVFARLSTDDE